MRCSSSRDTDGRIDFAQRIGDVTGAEREIPPLQLAARHEQGSFRRKFLSSAHRETCLSNNARSRSSSSRVDASRRDRRRVCALTTRYAAAVRTIKTMATPTVAVSRCVSQ